MVHAVVAGAGIGAVPGRLQPKNQRKRPAGWKTAVVPAVLNQVADNIHRDHFHVAAVREHKFEVARSYPSPVWVEQKKLAG